MGHDGHEMKRADVVHERCARIRRPDRCIVSHTLVVRRKFNTTTKCCSATRPVLCVCEGSNCMSRPLPLTNLISGCESLSAFAIIDCSVLLVHTLLFVRVLSVVSLSLEDASKPEQLRKWRPDAAIRGFRKLRL